MAVTTSDVPAPLKQGRKASMPRPKTPKGGKGK